MKNIDIEYMKLALEQAQIAKQIDEVPVGAVIVDEFGKVISASHNKVETMQDATAHAEVLAIKEATKVLDNWRLVNTTLYVTLEPCVMCAGAAILSRVKRIVWGCPDLRHGGCGSFLNVFENDHPIHKIIVEGGVLKEESKALLQQFFQEKRKAHVK